jgi:hypothetical protein
MTIWLSTSIVDMSSLECVSTIVATFGFDVCLVAIFGFFGFNFCHVYFLRSSVIFSNWPNLYVNKINK